MIELRRIHAIVRLARGAMLGTRLIGGRVLSGELISEKGDALARRQGAELAVPCTQTDSP
jgi:hypothetical protein